MDNYASIIIPTFRSLNLLKKTIATLEQQDYSADRFEVIIVDDGSGDETADWLKKYKGKINLVPVVLPANRGRSAARNIGARQSRGQTLILLDGDMLVKENFVRLHVESHMEPNVAVLGTVCYEKNTESGYYARYLETRGVARFPNGARVPGRMFLSGNASLDRTSFERINGFDETLKDYGEDIDFGIRLEKAGVNVIVNKDIKIIHLHTRKLSEILKLAQIIGEKTFPALIRKHPHLFHELRMDLDFSKKLPSRLIMLAVNDLFYSVIEELTALLNKWWAPSLFYQYLLFRNYIVGFRRSDFYKSQDPFGAQGECRRNGND